MTNKTLPEIREEIEKKIREELEKGIKRNKVLPLDWAMDRIKPVLEKGFTEYDKSIKEMIEDRIKILEHGRHFNQRQATKDFMIIQELKSILSKIGDSSEVEK